MLALDNERLKADLRARLEELRASRRRIVEATVDARRRLERDLHDGAQQRLVSLSLDLQLLRGRVADGSALELLDGTIAQLGEALSELRELARGIHPPMLSDRGLAPALDALAQRSAVPVELDVRLQGRLPKDVETAGYFVAAEALTNVAKYAGATHAQRRRHRRRRRGGRQWLAGTQRPGSRAGRRVHRRECGGHRHPCERDHPIEWGTGMIARLRVLATIAFGAVATLLAFGCGGKQLNALPQQPGLPAIKADPANAPVGAAAGVNVFSLSRERIRFFVITHGQASDPFWVVVQHGAQAAAAQLGVSVTYEAPDTFDITRMREMIQAAVATRPAGLVVSLPNPLALAPAIHAAERAGIPVISINSGSDSFAKLGTLLHVGESEYQAGYATGLRMRAGHVHRALCVIHEAGNLDLEQRCRGFAAALAAAGASTKRDRRKPSISDRCRATDRRRAP